MSRTLEHNNGRKSLSVCVEKLAVILLEVKAKTYDVFVRLNDYVPKEIIERRLSETDVILKVMTVSMEQRKKKLSWLQNEKKMLVKV